MSAVCVVGWREEVMGALLIGIVTVMFVPLPGSDSRLTVPP